MQFESAGWSGGGGFTAVLLDALKAIDAIEFMRIEDAPASRAESGYAFISNEIYLKFRSDPHIEERRRFGRLRRPRADAKSMTLAELAARLGLAQGVGEPDYSDAGLLQYLRTERIAAPYQTRGFKVIEMVRIYEVETPRRA